MSKEEKLVSSDSFILGEIIDIRERLDRLEKALKEEKDLNTFRSAKVDKVGQLLQKHLNNHVKIEQWAGAKRKEGGGLMDADELYKKIIENLVRMRDRAAKKWEGARWNNGYIFALNKAIDQVEHCYAILSALSPIPER